MDDGKVIETQTARTYTRDFAKFGEFTYSDADVMTFPWGLPGFPQLRKYIVLSLPEQKNFVWLQSIDDMKVALPLVDPWSIFSDYDPQLPPYAIISLEIERPEEFVVLCVTVVTHNREEMSVNLRAPIVVNLRTMTGRQVTLENAKYSIRTEVPRHHETPTIEGEAEEVLG